MKSRSVIAAAIALMVALTGCGARPLSELEQPNKAKLTLSTQQAPAADKAAKIINAVQPDKTVATKVPPQIRARGLRFSSSVGYPPMEMFAADGKTPIGVDIAIARALSRVVGLDMTITDEDFNAQIPGLLTHRYDFVMSSMTDSKEREQKVSFVDYVSAGAGFLVAQGNPEQISGPKQMCGKTISVVDNGSSLALAEQYAADCKKSGQPAIKILRFTGDQDALLALRSKRAQVNITDYVVAADKASDPSQKVQALPLAGTETPWGIAMNPDQKQLIQAMKAALQKLMSEGSYAKILAAYNVSQIAEKKVTVNGAIS